MKPLTLEQLLGKTFDRYQLVRSIRLHSKQRAEFIFHMTDWKEDLERLASLYDDPNVMERKSAQQEVFGFLSHATWHLNAAYRLLNGQEVPDPFATTQPKRVTKKSGKRSRRKAAK
jgi:hypothetical protein